MNARLYLLCWIADRLNDIERAARRLAARVDAEIDRLAARE